MGVRARAAVGFRLGVEVGIRVRARAYGSRKRPWGAKSLGWALSTRERSEEPDLVRVRARARARVRVRARARARAGLRLRLRVTIRVRVRVRARARVRARVTKGARSPT